MSPPAALGDIAAFLGVACEGDASIRLKGAAPLDQAGPDQLSFYADHRLAVQAAATRAGAVVVAPADRAKLPSSCAVVLSPHPHRDFARALARFFDTRPLPEAGVHPTAVVHPTAAVHPTARVGALAVVEAGAQVGEGSLLWPQAYVGPGCRIGRDCRIHAGARLGDGTRLGDRVVVQSGAVLGADGFGFVPDPPRGYVKVPQLGWVEVEDDVEIQANACVDRGALGPTLIRRGAKIDNLVQVGHNVEVGEHSVLVSQTGISGSVRIGRWVTFAGQSGAAGHLKVGDGAVVTAQSGIGKDVPPKAVVSGSPAVPMLEHHRGLAELGRLAALRKRVKELEARLAELERRPA